MSVPARLEREPSDAVAQPRTAEAFFWTPTPPRPDTDRGAEVVPIGLMLPVTDHQATSRERLTAAAKLSAVVVSAGLGAGLVMWAFGSAAVRFVAGLLS
jgi:hypothetical protein